MTGQSLFSAPGLRALESLTLDKAKSLAGVLAHLFLQPGSSFSLLSLASALVIAVGYVVVRRRLRGRGVSLKLIVRALFPRWLLRSASTKADLGFFLLNVFAVGALIGWGLISFAAVSQWTETGLDRALGAQAVGLPPLAASAILTLALFLAYEFAYWLDHWLSHVVPVLWEFHRVHHTAETLTPVTVFRVHPMDTLVFYNITAVITGLTAGVASHLMGAKVHDLALSGTNIILLAFIFATVHLQHSHVWIAFTGIWGRLFASPAHHQIHHSADPRHYGKNLGSCLALFDWLFGTLRIPTLAREPLTYGADAEGDLPHSITGGLITPFVRAIGHLKPGFARPVAGAVRQGLMQPRP